MHVSTTLASNVVLLGAVKMGASVIQITCVVVAETAIFSAMPRLALRALLQIWPWRPVVTRQSGNVLQQFSSLLDYFLMSWVWQVQRDQASSLIMEV